MSLKHGKQRKKKIHNAVVTQCPSRTWLKMDKGLSKPTGEHEKHRLASFTASRLNSCSGDERGPFLCNPTKHFSAGKKQ